MEEDADFVLTGITLCVFLLNQIATGALKSNKKKQKRRLWARKWLQRRNVGRGVASMVFKELEFEDPGSFKNFCRMSSKTFYFLLEKTEPFIKRQDTVLRECIPAKIR